MGVRRCVYGVHKLHVADIIKIDEVFRHNHQSFSIQAYGKDSRRKGEFADRRASLGIVRWQYPKSGRAQGRALVLVITRQRGDRTSATKDVEKSISKRAISPSCVS